MINWKYETNKKIPEGIYKITKVEMEPAGLDKVNDSIKFHYQVEGQNATAWSRLTFNTANPEQTNFIIGLMGDCFDIPDYKLNDPNHYDSWEGHTGMAYIVPGYGNEIKRFIKQDEQHEYQNPF